MEDLKLIVLDNIEELGKKIDNNLKKIYKTDKSFIANITRDRFSNGEGKIRINTNIKGKNVYIISDIANYDITYKMHGFIHHMSPDEHFQDIKRVISALQGYAKKIVLIMPLLYQSRQDKRIENESLDCALALQELERLGVNNIITFDVHNICVSNALLNLSFENSYASLDILNQIKAKEDINNILVVSPDMGGITRARAYADILKSNVGVFYKRRDLNKVEDGKNKIVEHTYLGDDVKSKNIIIVDDMIASGSSIIETIKLLKEKGAGKIYLAVTFAFFTEGIEEFDDCFNKGLFDKLYTNNLSYIPSKIKDKTWFEEVDLSKRVAELIKENNYN